MTEWKLILDDSRIIHIVDPDITVQTGTWNKCLCTRYFEINDPIFASPDEIPYDVQPQFRNRPKDWCDVCISKYYKNYTENDIPESLTFGG